MIGFMRMAALGGLLALGACTSGDFTSLGPISPLEHEKPQSFPIHGIDAMGAPLPFDEWWSVLRDHGHPSGPHLAATA